MFQSRAARASQPRAMAITASIVLLAAGLAGCSSTPRSHQVSWSAAGDPQQAPVVEARREAEVEDDGMEPQVAPPSSIRLAPDDPREPYSPNYGSRPVETPAVRPPAAPPARPAGPPSLRPTIRPRYASIGQ